MTQGIDLNNIYKLRNDFTIIGLTGQTGSGCSEISSQLAKGFEDGNNFENPLKIYHGQGEHFIHNSYRKHRIVFDYAKVNFKPFTEIKYKDVITLFLLKYPLIRLQDFLNSPDLSNYFIKSGFPTYNFSKNIEKIKTLKNQFNQLFEKIKSIELGNIKENKKWNDLYEFFFCEDFKEFSSNLHGSLGKNSDSNGAGISNTGLSYHKTIQIISNNLRRSGEPYEFGAFNADKIFSIVEVINIIIKSHRVCNEGDGTQIVINSLKNPLEIMFFKQRYSAFYSFAINKDKDTLESHLRGKFTMSNYDYVLKLLREEHEGGKNDEFFKQNIGECLQQADIHISFLSLDHTKAENDKISVNNGIGKFKKSIVSNSPHFSWRDQLLKYISLINHPGLITPSPEERCMQLAYTAKHNSGCISRHVGAAITDEEYSVKAIGWNNTPAGQVPCVLRKTEDLIDNSFDIDAFTNYERGSGDTNFKETVELHFKENIKNNKKILKGRNICFCFKSLQNSISEGKNQVHTRSLHAEESAFLQITKYGGTGIKNGILFSTASPCELCSKKAYQLGIKIIYYIDPYPGISISHILSAGDKPIEVRLFNGAIGSAYHRIYHPMMPYKDELTLLLGQNIKDLTSKFKEDNKNLKEDNEKLKAKIIELEKSGKTK